MGQLVGKRAGEASCRSDRPTPSWVNVLNGVTDDAGVVIRSCAQSEDDLLDVQIQNNRPYGQVLQYGAPVRRGWHQDGENPANAWRNGVADRLMTRNQLYIPPLGRASVGVPAWSGGAALRDP